MTAHDGQTVPTEQSGSPSAAGDHALARRMDHVDGLRTLALAGVLLFHFGLPARGGFLGVDLFFVISGFLMSRAMLRNAADAHTRNYSIRQFLVTRILRLCPALLTTVFVTIVAAPYFLPDFLTPRLFRAATSASLFLSNFFFLSEGGYHDLSSTSKPLLHTWSLAVEGQFYLLWSLLPFLASRTRALAAIMVLSFSSLAANLLLAEPFPTHFFFLMFARLYEFGAGCFALLLYDKLPKPVADIVSLAGTTVILHNFFYLDPSSRVLGLGSLPLLASCVALIATPNAWLNRRFFASLPLQFLGQISYSVYLVHWPAIVLSLFAFGATKRRDALVCAAVVTAILSPLLYYLIEEQFRSRNPTGKLSDPPRTGIRYCQALAGCIMLVIWLGQTSNPNVTSSDDNRGMPFPSGPALRPGGSYHEENIRILQSVDSGDEIRRSSSKSAPYYLVLGDSFAQHLAGLLRNVSVHNSTTRLAVHHGPNCLPATPSRIVCKREQKYRDICKRQVNLAWGLMQKRRPAVLIVAARWQSFNSHDFRKFERSLSDFKKHAGKVIVVGIIPEPAYDTCTCLLTHMKRFVGPSNLQSACPRNQTLSSKDVRYYNRIRRVANRVGCTFFDPLSTICKLPVGQSASNATSCQLWNDVGALYWDTAGHLTPYGSSLLFPSFLPLLQ